VEVVHDSEVAAQNPKPHATSFACDEVVQHVAGNTLHAVAACGNSWKPDTTVV
jgi:hypothetical protein